MLYSLFGFGWGLVLVSTFLINHFDLFGLRQIWLQLRGSRTRPAIRHAGTLQADTASAVSRLVLRVLGDADHAVTHLVFALATTAYILIAIQLEERDLIEALGDDYRQYRASVPMVILLSVACRPGAGSARKSARQ